MEGKHLSLVGWYAARSGVLPDAYWLDTLTSASQPCLAALPPAALSNLLWAYARWRHDPGEHMRKLSYVTMACVLPQALNDIPFI
jgi:hypothetical protein